jgi:hypothetical protein
MTESAPGCFIFTFTAAPIVYMTGAQAPLRAVLGGMEVANGGFPPWLVLPDLLVHSPTRSLVGVSFGVGLGSEPIARRCCEILNSPAIRFNEPGGPWDMGIYNRALEKYTPWSLKPGPGPLNPGPQLIADPSKYVEVLWGGDEPDEYVPGSINEADSFYTVSEQPTPFQRNSETGAAEGSCTAGLRWSTVGIHRVQELLNDFELKLPKTYRFPVEWFEPLEVFPDWSSNSSPPLSAECQEPAPKDG